MGQSSSSREPTMEDKLVREFVDSIEFDATACSTRSGLRRTVTVKAENLLMELWPTIRDREFVVGGGVSRRLGIQGLGVVCNIPYWLARYLKGVRDRDLICGGHIFKKKSLITIGVIMELSGGACYCPATCQVGEDDEVEEAAEEGAGGSFDVYRNISRGNWQVHQGQWMDAGVLSTRDNLEPHLQIDLFPGRKIDYHPYGYTRLMPPGYDYLFGPAPGGSS
ncbi:hypothetical protein Tco_0839298 [Tanacetum coccineum]|uniref:Uncharacterized protein n=1 Tax=Tanacetum coccineum TaxID=301880 RepID=A0ABQ5AQ73_9ASTR